MLNNFKVGDCVKITNLKNNAFKSGIILEFDEKILKLESYPEGILHINYTRPFLKIERID